jgi:hypothetical protein
MNIMSALVANTQPLETMQPAPRSLDHSAPSPQMLPAFYTALSNALLDTPSTHPLPVDTAAASLLLGMPV